MATQTGSFDFKTAKLAKESAEKVAINYLANDSSGVMVYDGSSGTQTPSSPTAGSNNVLIDSNGMYVRNGSTNLASFTGSSAQVGQNSAAHSVVDTNGMRIYASDGSTQIANLGYGEGTAQSGTAVAPYYTFGRRSASSRVGNYSVAEGEPVTVGSSEVYPHIASGWCSHAEGGGTQALGSFAHSEGEGTKAAGLASHAEGAFTKAADCSHAEGYDTEAAGNRSHAEGNHSVALGECSHAQNEGTIAQGNCQTALGKYNTADTTSALIIGNGASDDDRLTILTVDWSGNVDIKYGAKYKINGAALSASDVGAPAIGDTAWSTLATNFNYVKRSGIIFVDFYKTNQSLSTSWTTIGTLPSGYRPNHNLYGAAMTLTTTPIAYFINSSSGVVQMRTATGSGSYVTAFSVSYPVL